LLSYDVSIKVISSSHRVMFCLLYSPKQKIVKFHARKQIGKSHVIDIFTSEYNLSVFSSVILHSLFLKCSLQNDLNPRVVVTFPRLEICSTWKEPGTKTCVFLRWSWLWGETGYCFLLPLWSGGVSAFLRGC
jgi:hypothetical protein